MANIIPQLAPASEDRVTGGQVIDGCLKFDSTKTQYLKRTPGSAGNRKTWTWSAWIKRSVLDGDGSIFDNYFVHFTDSNNFTTISGYRDNVDDIGIITKVGGSVTQRVVTTARLRDVSAWYHIVVANDTKAATTGSDRVKIYINGELQTDLTSSTYGSGDQDTFINSTEEHLIGSKTDYHLNGYMSNAYLIDGQALDASYFGFTDPFTNTWRPKKYTGTFGTNGFWLPMDGSLPIGKDQSAKGNNWTLVNIGDSVSLEKATGALPILNTDGGGNISNIGVRTDTNHSSLVLALPLVGIATDVSHQINSGSTEKIVTTNGAAANNSFSNFYGGSYYFDGSSTLALSALNGGTNINDFTFESWIYLPNTSSQYGFFSNQASDNAANTIRIGTGGSGTWVKIASSSLTTPSGSVPTGRWFHFALTRSGSTVTMYLDGINSATMTSSETISDSGFYVGVTYPATTFRLNGYMQDVRFYTSAKYTGDFIPASTNPSIVSDVPSGVAPESKLAKVISGSVGFDGSSDSLTVTQGEDFNFGTGSWTIDCFAYFNSVTSSMAITDYTNNSSATGDPGGQWYFSSSNGLTWYQSSTSYAKTGLGVIQPKRWHHLAVVKNDSNDTIKIYVDGVEEGTQSHTESAGSNAGDFRIGLQGSTYFNGFISNLRVVKGTAVYTATFTPPTGPSTNITNTKLLCCQESDLAGSAVVSPNISGTNDGTVWSESATITPPSSGFNAGGGIAQAFDGKITSMASGAGSRDEFFVIDFSKPITVSSKLEVYMSSGASQFKINEGSFSSSLNNGAWRDLSFTGTLSKLTVKGDEPQTFGNFAPRLAAIRIDSSVILTDPVTRVGAPGPSTLSPLNTDIDSVRGQETGYATLNPLDSGQTLTNGNLTGGSSNSHTASKATLSMTSGKFYWEVDAGTGWTNHPAVGVMTPDARVGDQLNAEGSKWYRYSGNRWYDGTEGTSWADTVSANSGKTVGVAFDADNGTMEIYIGGVSQGYAFTGLKGGPNLGTRFSDTWIPAIKTYDGSVTINFGQKPFKFPPPPGFQALSGVVKRPTITDPKKYVGVTTYTGTGSAQTFNLGFKPDLMWSKTRSNSVDHKLVDSVRGLTKVQEPNNKRQDSTVTTGITATDSSGFSVGTSGDFNTDDRTYVTWCWKAGGSSNTFNVDDVGYASASDVNMNVGALNSSAYNKTQRWRDAMSGGLYSGQSYATLFNGSVNGIHSSANNSIKLILPTALSGNLKIWMARGAGSSSKGSNYDIKINGISVFDDDRLPDNTNATVDFGYWESIKSIEWGSGSIGNDWIQFNRIYIDGAELVDDDISTSNAPSIAVTGCSVTTDRGFSILKYTGSGSNGTIAHGLSQAPDFFFGRDLEDSGGSRDWIIYHQSVGATGRLKFTTGNTSTSSTFFQDTLPTNSLISVGTSNDINSTNDYIMYCWHDVPGLQKFGSYLSIGGNDANFVYLGFKPAVLWIKSSVHQADTTSWCIFTDEIYDNPYQKPLYANKNIQEGYRGNASNQGTFNIDLVSNGFKLLTNVGEVNEGSSGTDRYVYCAWAKQPAFGPYGSQSNAR